MNRMLQAWGGTLLGTVIGFANAIAVTRNWDDAAAADFFLVPVILLAAATISEFGLGALSVHDVARMEHEATQRSYVNAVLSVSARRAVVPGLVVGAVAWRGLDLSVPTSAAMVMVTVLSTVALAGQPLLRGLDRRVLASVGGPIGCTILTGAVVIPLSFSGADVAPVVGALTGYGMTGVLTTAVLARRVPATASVDRTLVSGQRSLWMAGHNATNMAGRQVDSMIGGSVMSDSVFTAYSVTIRMAAPLGLIAFASNQAVARDMHRIVDGDDAATRRAATLYRSAFAAATLAGVALVAVGPAIGSVVFGDSVEIRRGYLVMISVGYLFSVAGASGGMLLAAAERTAQLLQASLISLITSILASGLAIVVGGSEWAAPLFVSTWLVMSTTLAAVAVQRELGFSVWVTNFGATATRRTRSG